MDTRCEQTSRRHRALPQDRRTAAGRRATAGRWTRADLSGGFDLIETDDPQTLAVFSYMWNDLMHLTIVPVLEDAALAEVLKRAGA